ncbi:MAG: MgtC/SapB family protein, partial [Candidatus Kapaibacterium sp.]
MTYPEDVVKLMLAVVVGGLIGLEREYSSKAAGFRSIVLICIGSTLFTMLSLQLGGAANADRIAANIITGIGFIGAGVVFKDGVSITGITTASSIWATAALGMAIGGGHYLLALEGMMLVITV